MLLRGETGPIWLRINRSQPGSKLVSPTIFLFPTGALVQCGTKQVKPNLEENLCCGPYSLFYSCSGCSDW